MGNCHILTRLWGPGPILPHLLIQGCLDGRCDRVQKYIESEGVPVNYRLCHGRTALHYASFAGQLDVVKYLVRDAGADVNARSGIGMTPLTEAASLGQLQVVRFLVECARADTSAVDIGGYNALMFAAEQDHLGIVQYLAKHTDAKSLRYDFFKGAAHRNESWQWLHQYLSDRARRYAFLVGDIHSTDPGRKKHALFENGLFDRNVLNEIFQYL